MKVGQSHNWRYNTETWYEKKVAPGTWKFVWKQTKNRLGRTAPVGSGFPTGGKLHWRFKDVEQHAVKTGPNTYELVMTGTKLQAGYKTPRDKRWRR